MRHVWTLKVPAEAEFLRDLVKSEGPLRGFRRPLDLLHEDILRTCSASGSDLCDILLDI